MTVTDLKYRSTISDVLFNYHHPQRLGGRSYFLLLRSYPPGRLPSVHKLRICIILNTAMLIQSTTLPEASNIQCNIWIVWTYPQSSLCEPESTPHAKHNFLCMSWGSTFRSVAIFLTNMHYYY